MQAHDGVGPEPGDFAQVQVRAKAPIGQEHIGRLQVRPQLARQEQLVLVDVPLGEVEQRAAALAKEAHQFHLREAAAGLLAARLRPHGLIFRGLGHGGAGAVDDLDPPPLPALFGREIAFQLLGQMGADLRQHGVRQTEARLAIAAGFGGGQRGFGIFKLPPGGDPAQGIAAGGAAFEHLRQEGPEDYHRREHA
jgi:hypothetical protein